MTSKNYEPNGYPTQFEFANHLPVTVCFISYKKWVQREKYPYKAHLP